MQHHIIQLNEGRLYLVEEVVNINVEKMKTPEVALNVVDREKTHQSNQVLLF